MEVYSVPWLPATKAIVFPGLAPLITATGISNAASPPAGMCNFP